jgi:cell division protein FtsQ
MDGRASFAQSLKPKLRRRALAGQRGLAHGRSFGWLASSPSFRTVHRWFTAIIEFPVPRGAGSSAAAMLLLASASYGAVKGDHVAEITAQVQDIANQAAIVAGFGITEVALTGQQEVTRDDILAAAGVTDRSSLLLLDAAKMRAGLLANPWVAEATVLKLYPSRLRIEIKERAAFALWQKAGRVSLIAADGTVLEPHVPQRFASLPQLVGAGAEKSGQDFLTLLARYPELASTVEASVLVAERRWNLHLKGGVEVLLPERGADRALATLTDLNRTKKLLARDIVAVDLRLADRIAVRQSDAAAAVRDEAVKAAEKARKAKSPKGTET